MNSTKTVPSPCPEYVRLSNEVQAVLERLRELTTSQLQTFQAGDNETFHKIDQQLEMCVGERERKIGAFREHVKEHGCQT